MNWSGWGRFLRTKGPVLGAHEMNTNRTDPFAWALVVVATVAATVGAPVWLVALLAVAALGADGLMRALGRP